MTGLTARIRAPTLDLRLYAKRTNAMDAVEKYKTLAALFVKRRAFPRRLRSTYRQALDHGYDETNRSGRALLQRAQDQPRDLASCLPRVAACARIAGAMR